jgi:hypothetical protein
MKNFNEIIQQTPVFLNDWEKGGRFSVIANFEEIYMSEDEYIAAEGKYVDLDEWLKDKDKMRDALEKYKGVQILFASYGCANYSGDAWVLFLQDGKLYEVAGGHCSCYGLEGQWEPDEVLLPELENRLLNGSFGEDDWSDNTFKEELCKFLGVEFKKNL